MRGCGRLRRESDISPPACHSRLFTRRFHTPLTSIWFQRISSLRTHAAAGNLFLPQHHKLFCARVCALFSPHLGADRDEISMHFLSNLRHNYLYALGSVTCLSFCLERCCKKCPLIRVLAEACGMGWWCRLKNSNGSRQFWYWLNSSQERIIWSEVMQPARRSMRAGLPSKYDEPERTNSCCRNNDLTCVWPIKMKSGIA